ncbi:hypothetical protein BHE74_00002539 [Ensete ventricosum]|nr:hypothetical protein BHE74_00002539 [Ensete ventricosum]
MQITPMTLQTQKGCTQRIMRTGIFDFTHSLSSCEGKVTWLRSPPRVKRIRVLSFAHSPELRRQSTVYCLLRSLVEHSCINPKSLAFGYLDEKPIDIGLMKFLGLCPSALSWYLEFAFAFSTSSAPFTTNALPP